MLGSGITRRGAQCVEQTGGVPLSLGRQSERSVVIHQGDHPRSKPVSANGFASVSRLNQAPTIARPRTLARSTPRSTAAVDIVSGNIRFCPSGPSVHINGPSVHTSPPSAIVRKRNQFVWTRWQSATVTTTAIVPAGFHRRSARDGHTDKRLGGRRGSSYSGRRETSQRDRDPIVFHQLFQG